MEAEFSKQMSRRLADYENYITTECKSPVLQKDKVLVDREQLLDLLRDLREFHEADQYLEEGMELDISTVQMTKEQLLKNAAWQARKMIQEAEVVCATTLERAREEAENESERILKDARTYDARVRAEAQEIVNITLSDHRRELEKARRDLEDSREGILDEARKQGEQLLQEKYQEAEELCKQLDEEIEAYRETKEAEMQEDLRASYNLTQATLEEKIREATELYSDTVQKTDGMITRIVELYDQQIGVIQQDRGEIYAIVEKLKRQRPN